MEKSQKIKNKNKTVKTAQEKQKQAFEQFIKAHFGEPVCAECLKSSK